MTNFSTLVQQLTDALSTDFKDDNQSITESVAKINDITSKMFAVGTTEEDMSMDDVRVVIEKVKLEVLRKEDLR